MDDEERERRGQSSPQEGGPTKEGATRTRLRLRSLKVHSFRDVRPGTELRFGEGFHLILGKNATGKSTLLELLGAVSTLNFTGPFFAETPFHIEAEIALGEIALHVDVRRRFEPRHFALREGNYFPLSPVDDSEIVVRLDHPRARLRRELRVGSGKNIAVSYSDWRTGDSESEREFSIRTDPLDLSVGGALIWGAPGERGNLLQADPAVREELYHVAAQPGTSAPFDEALGSLASMSGPTVAVICSDVAPARSPWLPISLNFEGAGEPILLDLTRDSLLRDAVTQLGYESAKAYFGPGSSIAEGWSYSSPTFQFFRGGKAIRRHDQLSFGQQRLFSFAWYLACNPDIAIADELVNGLHSEWIDWCVEAIGDRQCFLTSQNPLLVDAVPLSPEEIKNGIILCEAVPETGQLAWRQLSAEEADVLSGALSQSRLDLLSDLLRALELW